ncbi:MAG TPA: cation-translocating P-type ATPase [Candidatus Deferrimicrobiaceae bacterium]
MSSWHTIDAAEAAERLRTDAAAGLSFAEAGRRLALDGPNELPSAVPVTAWKILLRQLKSALILILLVAIALSFALGHFLEASAISAIAFFTVVLGFVQEYRADRALDALRRMSAPAATVVRGGEELRIPAREVVAGDVFVLGAGDLVPADGRLLDAVKLKMDEAILTGESSPAEKNAGVIEEDRAAAGDRRNMVFSSTAVARGRGRAVVVATGPRTEVGKIGALLGTVSAPRTPLELQMDSLGKSLVRASLAIVGAIVAAGLIRGEPLSQMLLFGIAFAVAAVPEALPAVVTISLAIGARLMAKKNALIRRLPTVETLGCATVICSDKTGTLTTGEMTVREIYAGGRRLDVTGAGYDPSGSFLMGGRPFDPDVPLASLLRAAALCSDADLALDPASGRWAPKGDPTEAALVVASAKGGFRKAGLEAASPRRNEIPFSPERKRMTTLHDTEGGPYAFSKGAPEIILGSCTQWKTVGGDELLDAPVRAEIISAAQNMADRAMRVLAVSQRQAGSLLDAESEMTFLGLFGMMDPPRPEAGPSIETCRQAGIRPVMITGDHPATARAIARELGLLREGRVVTGAEIDAMTDVEFDGNVESIDVFARVSPAHKLRIVSTLQGRGHIVAMTGDGVNDAPALKKADIGVAMGISGTDVAREAAAMTLADDNFASIVAAVREGRAIFDNIKKYLMYLLSSNLGEIGLIAATMAAGLPLPLTAVQILYVNLATDGFPALALAVDPYEPDLMRREPRKPGTGILSRQVVSLMALGGLWSTAVNFFIFAWALRSGLKAAEAVTMTFVSLVLIQFFKAYIFRSERHSLFQRPFANRWLNLAVGWELLLLAAIVYVPALHEPFGTFSLGACNWLVVLPAALTVFPVLEAAKWALRKGWLGTDPAC